MAGWALADAGLAGASVDYGRPEASIWFSAQGSAVWTRKQRAGAPECAAARDARLAHARPQRALLRALVPP